MFIPFYFIAEKRNLFKSDLAKLWAMNTTVVTERE